jgi:glycosyltransferase involved in cell wall biosynthesis
MNVIFLGCSGFPIGYAQVQKQMMLARALANKGAKVLVVSNRGTLSKQDAERTPARGSHNGIPFVFTSINRDRKKNFLLRNTLRFFGKVNELILILYRSIRRGKNIVILSTLDTNALRFYHMVCKALRYKMVLIYDELVDTHTSGPGRPSFDAAVKNNCDALLPISHFLISYQKKMGNNLPMHLVPALTDYDYITKIQSPAKTPTLLFCGHACYIETIRLIVDSFENIVSGYKLELIVHGKEPEIARIKLLAGQSSRKNDIHIDSAIPYETLIRKYKSATLLLIPLLDTDRDNARFPHKIAEYCASGTPFVTTATGEVPHYFTHNKNAFIATTPDPLVFSDTIQMALKDPALMEKVSKAAYTTGQHYFDYARAGNELYGFLESINDKNKRPA